MSMRGLAGYRGWCMSQMSGSTIIPCVPSTICMQHNFYLSELYLRAMFACTCSLLGCSCLALPLTVSVQTCKNWQQLIFVRMSVRPTYLLVRLYMKRAAHLMGRALLQYPDIAVCRRSMLSQKQLTTMAPPDPSQLHPDLFNSHES